MMLHSATFFDMNNAVLFIDCVNTESVCGRAGRPDNANAGPVWLGWRGQTSGEYSAAFHTCLSPCHPLLPDATQVYKSIHFLMKAHTFNDYC